VVTSVDFSGCGSVNIEGTLVVVGGNHGIHVFRRVVERLDVIRPRVAGVVGVDHGGRDQGLYLVVLVVILGAVDGQLHGSGLGVDRVVDGHGVVAVVHAVVVGSKSLGVVAVSTSREVRGQEGSVEVGVQEGSVEVIEGEGHIEGVAVTSIILIPGLSLEVELLAVVALVTQSQVVLRSAHVVRSADGGTSSHIVLGSMMEGIEILL